MESKEYYENVIKQGEIRKESIYREIDELNKMIEKKNKHLEYIQEDIINAREKLTLMDIFKVNEV